MASAGRNRYHIAAAGHRDECDGCHALCKTGVDLSADNEVSAAEAPQPRRVKGRRKGVGLQHRLEYVGVRILGALIRRVPVEWSSASVGWALGRIMPRTSRHARALEHMALAMPEPHGVAGVICPPESPLLGLVSLVAPLIAMGNGPAVGGGPVRARCEREPVQRAEAEESGHRNFDTHQWQPRGPVVCKEIHILDAENGDSRKSHDAEQQKPDALGIADDGVDARGGRILAGIGARIPPGKTVYHVAGAQNSLLVNPPLHRCPWSAFPMP